MIEDARWPGEVRGDSQAVPWLNRLLNACKRTAVQQVMVTGGVGKMVDGTLYIAINSQPVQAFTGEYDQSKSYISGQTFLISSATTIAGVAVIAGYYGVPPAGKDVNGLPWAGYVPKSPTGNAVPQSPLPSIGAAPNDKFYAKLIMPSC